MPSEDEEEDRDEGLDALAAEEAEDGRNSPAIPSSADPVLDLRESEVLDGGQRISDFPATVRRTVNRPHPSILAVVAAERSSFSPRSWAPPFLENISHGQLQTLSAVLPDNPSLSHVSDSDKPSAYVCQPPPVLEGKGIAKRFGKDKLLIPMHSGLW